MDEKYVCCFQENKEDAVICGNVRAMIMVRVAGIREFERLLEH